MEHLCEFYMCDLLIFWSYNIFDEFNNSSNVFTLDTLKKRAGMINGAETKILVLIHASQLSDQLI